ncbi:stage III sporulation protein AF [Thermaerobacillus caldiproteolyticus]|uniref:Stage III sporulation protein AF n=1 Tax=Thermaerobacillus caldiproteolyticus TaxID=247480 RepID=A0A7V9Z3K5_9BACL|nr:stage III sporulation protein AF [Anoxybacillus caldiproteolyticus]MBA2873424.1 stage III sporulation protein AF [Anoxybacillus caldiproteolyticus]QPA30012.1 stage III sporulation protein AF [Anoxybacillus caldiproteolyticus]
MQLIIEWVTNIIIFILFAMIIDLLLPATNFQKYVKMVIGLILILLMLSPLLQLFSIDVDRLLATIHMEGSNQQETMKNEFEMKKKEIQASQRAYILEQMAVQMKKQVAEELMKDYGLMVQNISFQTNEKEQLKIPDDIKTIEVTLSEQNEQEIVHPVVIDASKPLNQSSHDEARKKEIASFFAAKWGVNEEKIAVQIEGRE